MKSVNRFFISKILKSRTKTWFIYHFLLFVLRTHLLRFWWWGILEFSFGTSFKGSMGLNKVFWSNRRLPFKILVFELIFLMILLVEFLIIFILKIIGRLTFVIELIVGFFILPLWSFCHILKFIWVKLISLLEVFDIFFLWELTGLIIIAWSIWTFEKVIEVHRRVLIINLRFSWT